MSWSHTGEKSFFRSRAFQIGAVAVLLLGIAIVLLWPRIMRRYERWSARGRVEQAADFFAKGDFEHATLNARRALQANPRDAEAARVMAKSLEAMGSPTAIQWRRHLDSLIPGNAENTLAWAKDAMAAGDAATAEDVLGNFKPDDRNGAQYHDLMARIALGKRDAAGAEAQWEEAAKLDPKDEKYRSNLATLRVTTPSLGAREDALQVLGELSAKPETRLAALRTLVGDAMSHGDAARTRELAKTLASDPKANLPDKLARLTVLRKLQDPESAAYLLELKNGAMSKPDELYQLLMWMNEHDLALMISEWLPELPPEMIAKPPVCIAVAEARARNSEWEKIEDTLFAATWGEHDHLRQAYRARALDHLSEPDQAAKAWEASLLAAGNRARAIETLARLTANWGWERRSEKALWKLAATDQCPRWARDRLWALALKRTDTHQLYRVAKLMMDAEPLNIVPRNDAVFLGLLTHSPEAALHEQAEALANQAPDNPNVVATFGLSLFQRGHADEAVAAMQKFTAAQLREPPAARYYGIFLSATDRRGEAAEYLKFGSEGLVLPEETALMLQAKAAASAAPDSTPPKPDAK